GPMASTQKMMLYMLPFIYVITGPGMPIGVLIYWLTTNVWTFCQQYLVIRAAPTPGTEAEGNRHKRINAKRARRGLEPLACTPPNEVCEPEPEQQMREKPVSKNRSGKKLTDEEKLERARAARAKAQEERRKAQDARAAGEGAADKKPVASPLNKGGQKNKRRK